MRDSAIAGSLLYLWGQAHESRPRDASAFVVAMVFGLQPFGGGSAGCGVGVVN